MLTILDFIGGDIFSSNNSQNIGSLSAITSAIRIGLGDDSVHVDHVWSDHDRYGGIPNFTGLVYGSGADGAYGTADDGNYYVYFISMSDMTTSPRYGITTTFTTSKLSDFTNAVAGLDHTKPLFIVSHMPLLDNVMTTVTPTSGTRSSAPPRRRWTSPSSTATTTSMTS